VGAIKELRQEWISAVELSATGSARDPDMTQYRASFKKKVGNLFELCVYISSAIFFVESPYSANHYLLIDSFHYIF
jgi:hypothetical protein